MEFATVLFLKRHVGKNLKAYLREEKEMAEQQQQLRRHGKKENNWKILEEEEKKRKSWRNKCSLTAFVGDVDVFVYKMDQVSFFLFFAAFAIYNIAFLASHA